MDLPKVVSGNQEGFIAGPAGGVDVGAVRAVGPQAWGAERAADTETQAFS